MEFNTTCTRGRSQRGFTMIEMLVATAIATVIFALIGTTFVFNLTSFAALSNYVDLDQKSRIALDQMSRDIRKTHWLREYGKHYLLFEDAEGLPLRFEYDPNARTLTRIRNGVPDSVPLLTECDRLEFSIYQRNHVPGTYDQYPTASAATCKLVQLTWVCSREVPSGRINTESMQSAKVVIRWPRSPAPPP